jgi:hypothetical protein
MSGVKGRSGRRRMRDEEKRLRTIDKAWEVIERQLSDSHIPFSQKVEVACKIVTKDMPNYLEHSGLPSAVTKIVIVSTKDGIKDKTSRIPNEIFI